LETVINEIVIVGRLGQDPELRHTQGGKAVCNLSVATSNKSGDNEYTEWHRVNVWDASAEACAKFLSKGKLVGVTGELRYREWEKDGVKQRSAEITARRVQFLSPPSERSEAPPPAQKRAEVPDDIPF
jgi:single-strand DNA-binding protein